MTTGTSISVCTAFVSFFYIVSGTAEKDFVKLRDEYGVWRLGLLPEYTTEKGFYTWNDRIQDYSPDAMDIVKTGADNFLNKLQKIPYTELSSTLQTDYDIMRQNLGTYIGGYQWKFYGAMNPISYLDGPGVFRSPSSLVSSVPFDTRGDYENFLTRLKNYPQQIQQTIDIMSIAVANNRTHHMASMKQQYIPYHVISHLMDSVSNNMLLSRIKDISIQTPEQSDLYKPFNESLDKISTISSNEKVDIRNRAKASIETIQDRLLYLQNYIKGVYMKNLRQDIGVSAWNNGSEYYRACLKWHLSLDMTPEEVHQKGLEEVERISLNMKKTMARLGFVGSIKEFFASLQGNPRFFKSNKSEILDIFDDIIHNQIEPRIHLMFKDLPNLPVEVRASPNDGPFGYYSGGSVDGSKPGVFYVNLYRPLQMSTTDFMALALHETNPGHHLQNSVSITSDLPKYRKHRSGNWYKVPAEFPTYTAYSEGWGLYAEYLGEELKLYKDDYSLMGRYSLEIFRACRLVVDTGIHYFGWTKSRAVNYFLNYTAQGQGTLDNEVDRYSTWPGQACAYKIGELKIKELRKKAETELGDKFDIKEFHGVVLKNGAMSLETLEKVVKRWILQTKSSPSPIRCDVSAADRQYASITLQIVFCIYTSYVNT